MMTDIWPINTLMVILFIIVLLSMAWGVIGVLKKKYPTRDYQELILRTRSWNWMILLIVSALLLGEKATIILFGFISFIALKEFYSIVPLRLVDRRIVFWAYLAIPVQYYWASTQWYGLFIIFIPVYMFLFLPLRSILLGETRGFINANAVIHWSLMLCVFCLSHIAYLVVLPVKNVEAGFAGNVLFLLFMTQFNDVSQYIWGKSLGKRKILPQISPNKTWEGFLGGFVTTTIMAGIFAPFLTPLSFVYGLGAGIIIALAGFIGDVMMSSVKRDLAIKDTGNFIPGHGGLLDRIDSLLYTTPLFFHYLYYFEY